MKDVEIFPRDFSKWLGEVVSIATFSNLTEPTIVKVTAAKNGAMIVVPIAGRRTPQMIEYSEISEIKCVDLQQEVMPPVTVETVRMHLFKYHAWSSPHSPAIDLMEVHQNLHKLEDDGEYKFGHYHSS